MKLQKNKKYKQKLYFYLFLFPHARSDPAAKCGARVGKDVEDVRNQDTGERQEAGEGKKPHHQRQVAAVQRTKNKKIRFSMKAVGFQTHCKAFCGRIFLTLA